MESLLSKINTRMNYISSNTDNAYITKQLNTIKIKLQEIKERKYSINDLKWETTQFLLTKDDEKQYYEERASIE